jgi:tRNA (Thr-GGU) A37 N-methylase
LGCGDLGEEELAELGFTEGVLEGFDCVWVVWVLRNERRKKEKVEEKENVQLA